MLISLDLRVLSMKWACLAGDTEVSSSFEMPSDSLTAQSQPLGDLGVGGGGGPGEAEEGLSQQHGVQVTCWD